MKDHQIIEVSLAQSLLSFGLPGLREIIFSCDDYEMACRIECVILAKHISHGLEPLLRQSLVNREGKVRRTIQLPRFCEACSQSEDHGQIL